MAKEEVMEQEIIFYADWQAFSKKRNHSLFAYLSGLGLSSNIDEYDGRGTFDSNYSLIDDKSRTSKLYKPSLDLKNHIEEVICSGTIANFLSLKSPLEKIFKKYSEKKDVKTKISYKSFYHLDLRELLKDSTNIYLGPAIYNFSGSSKTEKLFEWAFLESREDGCRRFFVDDKIITLPRFQKENLDHERINLDVRKILIPLERHFVFDLENREAVLDDVRNEIRMSSLRSTCLVVERGHELEIFPLYCEGYSLEQDQFLLDVKEDVGRVLNFKTHKEEMVVLEDSLEGFTFRELVSLSLHVALKVLEEFSLEDSELCNTKDILKRLLNAGFSNLKLDTTFSSLAKSQAYFLILKLFNLADVRGLEIFFDLDAEIYEERKEEFDALLLEIGNNNNKLHVFKNETLSSSKSYSLEYPMIVDVLSLREEIFKLFAETRKGKLIGFIYQGRVNTHPCSLCAGRGFKYESLYFKYQSLTLCENCYGTGLDKEVGSLTAYGLSLYECFQLELQEFIYIYGAEPSFLDKIKPLEPLNALSPIKMNEFFVNLNKNIQNLLLFRSAN